jgi:CHAD domain-containing protein
LDGSLDAPRAQVAGRPEPGKPISARQALQLTARACVQQIQAYEPRLQRSGSPEALHQIRVALRRWRAALSLFGPSAGGGLDRTRATLKWLARELNDARDLDVFAAALEPRGREGPGAEALWAALETARAQAYARAEEALQSDRLRRLLWRTAQTGRADLADQSPPARRVAAAALSRRWRRVKTRGRRLTRMNDEDRHELRIQAKKVRYGAELCGELFGHPRRQARMAKALKRMQDNLGILNDLAVGEVIALRLARQTGTPEAAFAAGMLTGTRARSETATVLKSARAAYEDFADVAPFWRD